MSQTEAQKRAKNTKYHREHRARKRKEAQGLNLAKPKRNGRKPKGVELLDGFNFIKTGSPSAAELKQFREVFELPPPAVSPFPDSPPDSPEGLDPSAYQMLEDMRHAYRHGGGKTKLVNFAKEDDRNFVFLVKELMKIESALLSAKIRRESQVTNPANNPQNFFVVIKGLEAGPATAIKAGSGGIDIAQIQQAVDPTSVGRNAFDDDAFKDSNDAPDMLFGAQTTIDDPWEGLDE